jgi:hypothetical protein
VTTHAKSSLIRIDGRTLPCVSVGVSLYILSAREAHWSFAFPVNSTSTDLLFYRYLRLFKGENSNGEILS